MDFIIYRKSFEALEKNKNVQSLKCKRKLDLPFNLLQKKRLIFAMALGLFSF